MARTASAPPPDRADRAAERNRLLGLIAGLADVGVEVPCRDVEIRGWWTSEDQHEQEAAVHRCRDCPVLAECRTFGRRWPDQFGVYGAETQPQRQKAARGGTAA